MFDKNESVLSCDEKIQLTTFNRRANLNQLLTCKEKERIFKVDFIFKQTLAVYKIKFFFFQAIL